jgi:cytochrome b6-f complex iron-sulfur subunit
MESILHAIATAAGILLPVLILITGVNAAVSRRAERGPVLEADTKVRVPMAREPQVRRRSFLSWIAVAWAAFFASTLTTLAGTVRFMFPNVLFEPPSSFKAGYPEELHIGEVDQQFKQSHGIWLVKDFDPDTTNLIVYALSDICTHLGCIPNWLPDEQEFKCPCHGSGYYKSGINFEGPTPRPLERFAISLTDDGQIFVDKSMKFQQEKGQWKDPRAFLRAKS